jgi:hypothetical protein
MVSFLAGVSDLPILAATARGSRAESTSLALDASEVPSSRAGLGNPSV